MKQSKKVFLVLSMMLMMVAAAGCGKDMMSGKQTGNADGKGATSETGTQTDTNGPDTGAADNTTDKKNTDSTDKKNDNSGGSVGNAVEDVTEGAGNVAEDAAEGAGNAIENVTEGAGEAAGDVVKGAGRAVDDVADGFGDAVDNLGGGSFDTYEDARSYFMKKLTNDNAAAHYELKNEKKDLISYNSKDADARGYEFTLYETDGNERIGRYYVDKDTGKIYRYMGKDSIEAY